MTDDRPFPKRQARSQPPTLGARITLDDPGSTLAISRVVIAPDDYDSDWRILDLDAQTLSRTTPTKLLEYLANLSPAVSRALWDFLRLCNPGWTLRAIRPGTDDEDARGQAALNAFRAQMEDIYGTLDVVWNRLFLAGYMRGAMLGELVLDATGRTMVDFATPDPATVRFERVNDPVRGPVWALGQWQSMKWVRFDSPTIRYVPIDPMPGKPYGRAPAHPALFSALFLMGMLHDLRRVVVQQGYPRIDLKVLSKTLEEMMPANDRFDPNLKREWQNKAMDEIKSVYRQLEPDDAYVHSDAIEVGRPVGTVDSSSLGAIDGLIDALERMLVQALKTMPLMMGITDGVSEANANRQWEIQAAGIKSLQHLCESLVGRVLTVGLQAQGIQATAELRFAELRAAEMMRDAQTEQLQISNAVEKVRNRWWTNDEAAQAIVEHESVDPNFVPSSGPGTAPPADTNPDPGSNRARDLIRNILQDRLQERAPLEVEGKPLPRQGDDPVEITEDDKREAIDMWDRLMADVEGVDLRGILDAKVE